MHLMLDQNQNAPEFHGKACPQTLINPGGTLLRRAVRRNIVSFPSQIPVFAKQPPDGMQWRMVLLFFVRGWSLGDVASRFKVPKHRVCQILNFWSVRALTLGFVEVIDPEAFAKCCRVDVEHGRDRDQDEILMAERALSSENLPQQFPEAAPAAPAPVALLPEGMRSGGMPSELAAKSAGVIEALDVAIAHCEAWGDEFWVRTATHLRDLRAVAATALKPRRAIDQTDGRFTAFQGGKSNPKHELSVSEEEHISDAVA